LKNSESAGDSPASGVGQQVVDLAYLREVAVHLGRAGLGAQYLAVEKLVIDSLHGLDVRPLADKAAPGKQRDVGTLNDLLPVVSGGRSVGNVVAGRQHADLCRIESADADTEDAHGCSAIEPE
jgi:hypothetical protein